MKCFFSDLKSCVLILEMSVQEPKKNIKLGVNMTRYSIRSSEIDFHMLESKDAAFAIEC